MTGADGPTGAEDGLHGELVASSADVAVERWDVLLLPEGERCREHRLDLTHMALLKPPERTAANQMLASSQLHLKKTPKPP